MGCGAAGRPLGAAWLNAGHVIGAVICRTSAAEAVLAMREGIVDGTLDDAEVIVFATPDDALASAAAKHTLRADQVALHVSGAHPSTILEPTGAHVASRRGDRVQLHGHAPVACARGLHGGGGR